MLMSFNSKLTLQTLTQKELLWCSYKTFSYWLRVAWSQMWFKIHLILNLFNANPTKWSHTLKQFVGKLLTNCLIVFDHFGGLVLKGLMSRAKKTLVWLFVFTLLKGLLHAKLLRNYKLWNFKQEEFSKKNGIIFNW